MIESKIKLNDYVVLDIENPNKKADSICQIAVIQVKNKEIVYQNCVLINPEDYFDDINMKVHNITPDMVKNAVTFDVFWNEIKDIITNNVIIGHGIKYDISVIAKTLNKYNIELPELNIICTQHLAQKYLNVPRYRLDCICEFLNIDIKKHHDALCDASATREVYEHIENELQLDSNDIEPYKYENRRNASSGLKIEYTENTKLLQQLKEIIEFIMVDGKIESNEINFLKMWLSENKHLAGNYPFDKINAIINNVLEDEEISAEEYKELNVVFNDFIDPLSTKENTSEIIFNDKLFCLTGTFISGSKDDIEKKIVSKGGICSKGVTSKLNYLVVGDAGSDAWKFGNYGGKVQKAMELNEKGKNIIIIAETEFINELNK